MKRIMLLYFPAFVAVIGSEAEPGTDAGAWKGDMDAGAWKG